MFGNEFPEIFLVTFAPGEARSAGRCWRVARGAAGHPDTQEGPNRERSNPNGATAEMAGPATPGVHSPQCGPRSGCFCLPAGGHPRPEDAEGRGCAGRAVRTVWPPGAEGLHRGLPVMASRGREGTGQGQALGGGRAAWRGLPGHGLISAIPPSPGGPASGPGQAWGGGRGLLGAVCSAGV